MSRRMKYKGKKVRRQYVRNDDLDPKIEDLSPIQEQDESSEKSKESQEPVYHQERPSQAVPLNTKVSKSTETLIKERLKESGSKRKPNSQEIPKAVHIKELKALPAPSLTIVEDGKNIDMQDECSTFPKNVLYVHHNDEPKKLKIHIKDIRTSQHFNPKVDI